MLWSELLGEEHFFKMLSISNESSGARSGISITAIVPSLLIDSLSLGESNYYLLELLTRFLDYKVLDINYMHLSIFSFLSVLFLRLLLQQIGITMQQ